MSVTVTEKFESRRLTTGENATLELAFNVFGTDDEAEAKQALLNEKMARAKKNDTVSEIIEHKAAQ